MPQVMLLMGLIFAAYLLHGVFQTLRTLRKNRRGRSGLRSADPAERGPVVTEQQLRDEAQQLLDQMKQDGDRLAARIAVLERLITEADDPSALPPAKFLPPPEIPPSGGPQNGQ